MKLSECYSKMPVPSPEIIHKSLSYLIHEGKIEHNGTGYHILSMDDTESILTTDIDEASIITTHLKPTKNHVEEPPKDDKIYLMYKDGVLTKHTLPETIINETGQASRPTSYPANQTLGSIPESRTAFQRSQSMRERRNANGSSRDNFERTNSMRVASMDAYDAGYITSDNEAKQSCLGRLLSKSYQKKPVKTSPKTEIHVFSGQFPPSDVHDPFFSYAHWADRDADKDKDKKCEDDNKMEEKKKGKNREKDGSPSKQRKSLPKDSNKYGTGQHRLDHGRLTMTAVSLQQKYQDMNQESMPESESEFLRPTQMYDNRYRTKAVSQQSQVCKTVSTKKPPKESRDGKEDKIKHFFSSMESSRPVNPKPFQGLTSDEEKELDQYPSKETKSMKERRQARVFADAKLSDLDADDLSAVSMPKDVKIVTKSVPSQDQMARRPGRAIPVSKPAEVTVPPPAKQVSITEKSKAVLPEKSSSLNYKENNQLRLRTEAAINRSRPKSFAADSSLKIRSKSPQSLRKSVHGDFYGDEEIDELMKDELKKEKVRKAGRSLNVPGASCGNDVPVVAEVNDQQQNEINRRLESKVKVGYFERVGSATSSASSHDYISIGDSETSSQLTSRSRVESSGHVNGSLRAGGDITAGIPPLHSSHKRVESLSSMGDSGFNSPRSSILQGRSNGVPTPNQELVEPPSSSVGSTSVIIRPVPRKNVTESEQSAVFGVYCKPPSSASDQSSGSEVTVKARLQGPQSNDEKSDSSDRASSYSSHSRGGHKGMGHGRGSLGHSGPNNFEVIGTV